MAYELELKATLDTSDAEQKLQQLQNKQNVGNESTQKGVQPSGGTQAGIQQLARLQNVINNISRVISRQTSSIDRLIAQLSQQNKLNQSGQQKYAPKVAQANKSMDAGSQKPGIVPNLPVRNTTGFFAQRPYASGARVQQTIANPREATQIASHISTALKNAVNSIRQTRATGSNIDLTNITSSESFVRAARSNVLRGLKRDIEGLSTAYSKFIRGTAGGGQLRFAAGRVAANMKLNNDFGLLQFPPNLRQIEDSARYIYSDPDAIVGLKAIRKARFANKFNRRAGIDALARGSDEFRGITGVSQESKFMRRQLVALGSSIVLGGMQDYLNAAGNTGAARAAGYAGDIAQYTGMGAMMGGPGGALIGLGAGVLNSGIKEATYYKNREKETRDYQTARFVESNAIAYKMKIDAENASLQRMIDTGDEKGLRAKLASSEKKTENARQTLDLISKNTAYKGEKAIVGNVIGNRPQDLVEYEKETKRLVDAFGSTGGKDFYERIAARQKNADDWKKAQAQISAEKQNQQTYIDALTQMRLDSIDKQYDKREIAIAKGFGGFETFQNRALDQNTRDEAMKSLEAVNAKLQNKSLSDEDRMKLTAQAKEYKQIIKDSSVIISKENQDVISQMKNALGNAPDIQNTAVSELSKQGYMINRNADAARMNSYQDDMRNYIQRLISLQEEQRDILEKDAKAASYL